MNEEKVKKWYVGLLIVLSLSILILSYLDSNAKTDINDLYEKYDVDIDNGEQLVKCDNGSYDVYRSRDVNQLYICGDLMI